MHIFAMKCTRVTLNIRKGINDKYNKTTYNVIQF